MGNRKIGKSKLSKEWFKKVLKMKGVSIRGICDNAGLGVGWNERTIRRALADGKISPDLLDEIARALDVHPDYLAGKYAWTLDVLEDEGAKRYFLSTYLKPANYPYSKKEQESLGTRRYILNTLLMHGVDEEEYNTLDYSSQHLLYARLDNAVTNTLKAFFPGCSKMSAVDYAEAFEWQTDADVIEAMLDYLLENGLIEGSFPEER